MQYATNGKVLPAQHISTGIATRLSASIRPYGAMLDTNILINFLAGHVATRDTFDELDELYTSAVCYMEVMVGCESTEEETAAANMFAMIKILPILSPIEDVAVAIRKCKLNLNKDRKTKVRLPDAIIHSTALVHDLPVITNMPRTLKRCRCQSYYHLA